MKKLNFAFAVLVAFLASSVSLASTTYLRIAECSHQGGSIQITIPAHEMNGPYPIMGMAQYLPAATSSAGGELVAVKVRLTRDNSYSFDFVGYSGIPDLGGSDCVAAAPPEPDQEREQVVSLKLKSLFMFADVEWNDPRNVEELMQACVAIPIELNILCGQSTDPSGLLFCNWIQMLDTTIPVDSGRCF